MKVSSIFSNFGSFVAVREDGSVVSWGNPYYGGDSSSVEEELDGNVDVVNILPIYKFGFIATRSDGSQVYWGAGRILF